MPSRLLSLPAEIRNQIYADLLGDVTINLILERSSSLTKKSSQGRLAPECCRYLRYDANKTKLAFAIAKICRQTYSEAMAILYKNKRISCKLTGVAYAASSRASHRVEHIPIHLFHNLVEIRLLCAQDSFWGGITNAHDLVTALRYLSKEDLSTKRFVLDLHFDRATYDHYYDDESLYPSWFHGGKQIALALSGMKVSEEIKIEVIENLNPMHFPYDLEHPFESSVESIATAMNWTCSPEMDQFSDVMKRKGIQQGMSREEKAKRLGYKSYLDGQAKDYCWSWLLRPQSIQAARSVEGGLARCNIHNRDEATL